MAMYQKYRPKTLSEIVGQDFVRQTLSIALQKNKASHAYLFFGSRGTGKTSTARILAKALNCQNPTKTGDPCNVCNFCTASDSDSFVDLIEIDGASNRKIEHARALIEKIHFAPTLGKRKVYIIDEVHMLTKEAFNALLKTIEEPPEHAYFILATTELQKVPETIRSRCQTFTFHRFTPEQISGRLQEIADKEGIVVKDREALYLIAKRSAGGLRDAIGLFEQASTSGEVSVEYLIRELGIASSAQVEEFFDFLEKKSAGKAIGFISKISSEGLSLDAFLEQFLGLLREKMLFFSLEEENQTVLQAVLKYIEYFDAARRSLRDAPIPTLPVEIAILQSIGIAEIKNPEEKKNGWNPFGKKNETGKEEKKESPALKGETEKLPKKKEEESKVVEKGVPLSKENLKENWGRILESADDAVLRLALKQSMPSVKDQKTIVVLFPAESWKTQAEDKSRFKKLQTALCNIFGPEIILEFQVQSVVLEPIEKPLVNNDNEKPVTDPSVISEIFSTGK